MKKEELEVIKEVDITNNCPECFNQELKLTFYQKHEYRKLYHRTTGTVTHQIGCKKCESIIYPVNWTDDIERTFDYYRKTVSPTKASLRFTPLFYILLTMIIAVVGTLGYLIQAKIIEF